MHETKTPVKISKDIAGIIPRLFDGSPATMVAEVVQNARRAGASRIKAYCDDTLVVKIVDDGCGMSFSELERLVTLRESVWSEAVEKEDPAGMGFFSLYHADSVVVTSRKNGQVSRLYGNKDSFEGGNFTIMDVTDSPVDESHGFGDHWTVVAFTLKQYCKDIVAILHQFCAYSGIPDISVNGRIVEPSSFTIQAAKRKENETDNDDVGVVELFDTEGHLSARVVISENPSHEADSMQVAVNFFGIVNRTDNLCSLLPRAYFWDVDAISAAHFRLVLPARNAISAANDSLQAQALRESLYKALVSSGRPHFLEYEFYQEALTLGYALPESFPALKDRRGEKLEHTADCVMPLCGILETMTFAEVFDKEVAAENKHCVGYKWYDQIPMAMLESSSYDYLPDDYEDDTKVAVVDDIELVATLGEEKLKRLAPAWIFDTSGYHYSHGVKNTEELTIFVSRSWTTTPEKIEEAWNFIGRILRRSGVSSALTEKLSDLYRRFVTAVRGQEEGENELIRQYLHQALVPIVTDNSVRFVIKHDKVLGTSVFREETQWFSATALLYRSKVDGGIRFHGYGCGAKKYDSYRVITALQSFGEVTIGENELVLHDCSIQTQEELLAVCKELAASMRVDIGNYKIYGGTNTLQITFIS